VFLDFQVVTEVEGYYEQEKECGHCSKVLDKRLSDLRLQMLVSVP
jgi:hypothetical protein